MSGTSFNLSVLNETASERNPEFKKNYLKLLKGGWIEGGWIEGGYFDLSGKAVRK